MRSVIALLIMISSQPGLAQLNATSQWELSPLVVGPLLPSSVSGVKESIMMTGARLGKGIGYYRPELVYSQGSEGGNSFQILALSVKNPIYIDDLADIRPFFLTGLQVNLYEPVFSGATAEEERSNGFHLGFGLEMDVGSGIQVRNDYYFMNGGGRSLLVGLAVQFAFGGESTNQN